ncbi:MAG TPA: hypothetical protein VEF34_08660 [Syntrophobacteraceae bacterium]|nr:hypothetical protein [Syntrophobacteraceae bacterium]
MSLYDLVSDYFGDIFPPRRIKVLGAGRFGRLAAERLKLRFPDALVSVTDRCAARVDDIIRDLAIAGEVQDFIRSIGRIDAADDLWLIPAVPVHVGFEWVVSELEKVAKVRTISVPQEVDSKVPNPLRGPAGTLYASFATFICPDYCSEPEEICTFTGKGRLGNLYDIFGEVPAPGFDVAVLRSWQLAPGVGGYPARGLRELFAGIVLKPGRYLIATSCRCHGVMDGLEWED